MLSRSVTAVEQRYRRGALWVAITIMFSWHVGAALPTVIRTATGNYAVISYSVWLVYLVIGILCAVVLLRGGGAGMMMPLTTLPPMLAGSALISYFNASGTYFDHYNWAYSDVGWVALLALLRRPPRELIGFFVANFGVSLAVAAAIDDLSRLAVSHFVISQYNVIVLPVTILFGSRALATMARRIAETQETQAKLERRQLAAQAVHSSRRLRHDTVREAAADLLAGLADDRLDPSDPTVQQGLRVATTRLRRLIVETDDVPDPLLHELRACADAAERRGVAVELPPPIGAIPELSPQLRRALAEPIIHLLAGSNRYARVTVIAAVADVAVAAVADAHADHPIPRFADDPVQVSFEAEEGRLWAQARWRRSPSP